MSWRRFIPKSPSSSKSNFQKPAQRYNPKKSIDHEQQSIRINLFDLKSLSHIADLQRSQDFFKIVPQSTQNLVSIKDHKKKKKNLEVKRYASLNSSKSVRDSSLILLPQNKDQGLKRKQTKAKINELSQCRWEMKKLKRMTYSLELLIKDLQREYQSSLKQMQRQFESIIEDLCSSLTLKSQLCEDNQVEGKTSITKHVRSLSMERLPNLFSYSPNDFQGVDKQYIGQVLDILNTDRISMKEGEEPLANEQPIVIASFDQESYKQTDSKRECETERIMTGNNCWFTSHPQKSVKQKISQFMNKQLPSLSSSPMLRQQSSQHLHEGNRNSNPLQRSKKRRFNRSTNILPSKYDHHKHSPDSRHSSSQSSVRDSYISSSNHSSRVSLYSKKSASEEVLKMKQHIRQIKKQLCD